MSRAERDLHVLLLVLASLLVLTGLARAQSEQVSVKDAGDRAPSRQEPGGLVESAPATMTYEPSGEAASFYRTDELLPAQLAELGEEAQVRWPELMLDANLSRAAAAYVQATTQYRSNDLPPGLLEFLVRWAGCPEPPMIFSILSTTEDGTSDVLDSLSEMMSSADVQLSTLGVGRIESPRPPFKWRWALVLSRRMLTMRPFPAQLELGQREVLRFQTSSAADSAQIVVLRPGGAVESLPVRRIGASWAGVVDAGDQPGTLWIQLLAKHSGGQAMVGFLEVEIGGPRARVWSGQPIPDESGLTSTESAEGLMVELINRDRGLFGLAALEVDPLLSEVARAHSRDMAMNGFFSHVSPRFGAIGERLQEAGYAASVARENISRATAVHESQASLMTSPGHRANLLAVDVSRLGVGVVRDLGPGGHQQWVVTQVFAEPIASLDGGSLEALVEDIIVAKRRVGGAQPLVPSAILSRWARRLASAAALSGELDQGLLVAAQQDLTVDQTSVPTIRAEMVSFSEVADCRLGDMISLPELVSYGCGAQTTRIPGELPTHTVVILAATR